MHANVQMERASCLSLLVTCIVAISGATETKSPCGYNSSASSTSITSKVFGESEMCCEQQRYDFWQGVGVCLSHMFGSMSWKEAILIASEKSDIPVSSLLSGFTRYKLYVVRKKESVSEEVYRVFSAMNQYNALHIVVMCDKSCVLEILRQAITFDERSGQQGYFTFLHEWFIFTEARNLPLVERNIRHLSNVAIFSWQEPIVKTETLCLKAPQATVLTVVWTSAADRKLRRIAEFEWNSTTMLAFIKCPSLQKDDFFPNAKNFKGQHLLVGTFVWAPFVSKSFINGTAIFSGFCIEVLKSLSEQLNFTYTLVEPPDGQWGAIHNGSWTGLVKQLLEREVDMVVTAFSANYLREEVIDFVETPMYFEESKVIVKIYGDDQSTLKLYSKIFQEQVWLGIGLSVVLGGFVTWILNRFSPCCKFRNQQQEDNRLFLLHHALWFAGGAVLTQGSVHLPRHGSGRIFMAVWWFYCVILVAVYTGNLIAFISVDTLELPFTTLEEMVEQDEYIFGTQGGSVNEINLESAKSGVNRKIWIKMQEFIASGHDVLNTNHSHHLHMMNTTRYAYMSDVTGVAVAIAGDCSFKMLSISPFEVVRYSVALQNNSAYSSIVSNAILNMQDGGLMARWKVLHWPKDMASLCSDQSGVPPAVSLDQISGVFTALAVLLAVGLGVLVIEMGLPFLLKHLVNGIWAQPRTPTSVVDGYRGSS